MAKAWRLRPGWTFPSVLALLAMLAGCGTEPQPRDYRVGEGAGDLAGYETAYVEGGAAEGMGTPTTGVEQWGFGCRQLFRSGRSTTSALLQQPCGNNQQVFAVTGEFWDVYRAAGDAAIALYGFPIGRRGQWKQGWTQGFGSGGVFTTYFMQLPGAPSQTLSMPLLEFYLSFDDRDTRFGYPTAKQQRSDNRLCQAFEHAVITATDHDGRFTFHVATGAPPRDITECAAPTDPVDLAGESSPHRT